MRFRSIDTGIPATFWLSRVRFCKPSVVGSNPTTGSKLHGLEFMTVTLDSKRRKQSKAIEPKESLTAAWAHLQAASANVDCLSERDKRLRVIKSQKPESN